MSTLGCDTPNVMSNVCLLRNENSMRRQREAASFGDGPLRVIAGPGTGKTTTLTARVEFLLDHDIAPNAFCS